jgi:hypothetical protein
MSHLYDLLLNGSRESENRLNATHVNQEDAYVIVSAEKLR